MFFRLWFFIVHFSIATRCNYTILSVVQTYLPACIYLCVCNYIYVYASVSTYIYLRVRATLPYIYTDLCVHLYLTVLVSSCICARDIRVVLIFYERARN